MKKISLTITIISICLGIKAQCTTQSTISDGFESYSAGTGAGLPDCWETTGSFGLIKGVRDNAGESYSGNNYISIYTFFTANATTYIVTPELSTIDGNHYAEFYVNPSNQDITLEYGTMSDPTDESTFIGVSSPALVHASYSQIETQNIPQNSGHKYFAMKFVAPTTHSTIKIDDFSWKESVSTASVEDKGFLNDLLISPNPANTDVVKISFHSDISNYDMSISNAVGQIVFKGKGVEKIDVSSWKKGVYFIQLSDRSQNKIFKLIVN